ncbi:hypothetical protein [Pseudomonas sp. WC2]|uniref:hypothetical protein n=1 Tax=Pseudomonas sp. WC2 TaxID=3424773 RepID=UPI003D34DC44
MAGAMREVCEGIMCSTRFWICYLVCFLLCTLRPVVQIRTQCAADVGQWTKNRQFAKPPLCSIIARKTNRVVHFKLLCAGMQPIISFTIKTILVQALLLATIVCVNKDQTIAGFGGSYSKDKAAQSGS